MSLFRTALAFALAVALAACGGAETLDQAIAGLEDSYNAKDYAAVVTGAGPLLTRCESEGAPAADAWRVEKLRLQSLAKQGHGAKALEHLTRLEGEHDGKVDAKLYGQVGQFVMNASGYDNALSEAIDVLDAGAKKWPDKADFFKPQIEVLKERVLAGGSDADRAKLQQLGYL